MVTPLKKHMLLCLKYGNTSYSSLFIDKITENIITLE